MRMHAIAALLYSPFLLSPIWAQQDAPSPKRLVEPPRQAFVTSVKGPPIFANWTEASKGMVGVDAADSICQNLAAAESLNNPSKFVAWVSDSSDDAYCRIHNLTGKKSSNCGQKILPASAGPWMRIDGQPWASTVDQILGQNGVVYTPLNISELGTPVDTFEGAYTATSQFGDLNGDSCSDWQGTPAESATVGAVYVTTQSWTSFSSIACNAVGVERHLYCLETEPGPALELPDSEGRLAFLTSMAADGVLGGWVNADPGSQGLAAGDSICNNLAQLAGLPDLGYYKAWLSDATSDASSRFESDGPWYRLDGFKVAENMADLTDGSLPVPINLAENNVYYGNWGVWTGTLVNGSKSADTCDSWQSPGAQGYGGRAHDTTSSWTSSGAIQCDSPSRRLYCLSDRPPGLIQANGFENL